VTKEKSTSSTNVSPQECVGKEGIPSEPFTGYVRIDGWRARKEREGGLATSLLIAPCKVADVSYADAVKGRRAYDV
jgi:hypothetical protein